MSWEWARTNVDVRRYNIDQDLCIKGISELIAGKIASDTYCNLNVSSVRTGMIAPDGYDRYILGFWHEILDESVFVPFYHRNPSAEFVILTDMRPNDLTKLARCSYVELNHWKYFLSQKPKRSDNQRIYKISSLSNRVNETRFFITAKLLDRDDVYCTWNARYLKNQNYDYIFSAAGWPNRDSLLSHSDRLRYPINAEIFYSHGTGPNINSPDDEPHPAYYASMANFINETKDNSWHVDFGQLPSPYLSEKTWKPLLLGNALLFTGQYGTQQALERFGLRFDYPWDCSYSDICGDLERLDRTLDLIDQILNMSLAEIANGIADSVQHNQDLIESGQLARRIDERNQKSLSLLEKVL